MAQTYCRLCLSREKLLNIFDPELTNCEQLRICILICTGVNILIDDIVTKYVCHTCCEISIKMFKFRKNAMANDKTLKDIFNQKSITPSSNISSTVQLNEFLVNKTGMRIRFGDELNSKLPTARRTKRYAVHPSIFKLVKCYPKIVLPDDVITVNCNPRVCVKNLDLSKLKRAKEEVKQVDNSDLSLFKKRFPGISITKLSGSNDSTEDRPMQVDKECVDRTIPSVNSTWKLTDNSSDIKIKEENDKEEREQGIEKNGRRRDEEETKIQGTETKELPERKRKRLIGDEDKNPKKIKIPDQFTADLQIPEPTSKIRDFLENFQDNDSNISTFEEETIDQSPHTNEDYTNLEISMITANMQTESQDLKQSPPIEPNGQLEGWSLSTEINTNRKVLRPRKSRPSFFTDEALYDDSDEDYIPELDDEQDEDEDYDDDTSIHPQSDRSLLKTFDEELTFPCDICNKMFDHPTKVKLHRWVHKDCIVCKKTFVSRKALNYHLNDICYKKIIANQPILCLKRCDEKPQSNEMDFDVLCISDDDESQPQVHQQLEKLRQMDTREKQRIFQIFEKYHKKVPPYYKVAASQEDAQLYKAVITKGQGTMTNMYPILKHFRVPVILKEGTCMTVEMIDTVADRPLGNQNTNWASFPIRNLSNLVNAKTKGGRQIAPKPTTTNHLETPNVKSSNPHISLKDLLDTAPTTTASTQPQPTQTTLSTSTAQPIILNTLPSNTQSLVLNQVSNDRILAIQLSAQTEIPTVITTRQQSVNQNQYTIQTHQQLPALLPKTYAYKTRPQPVYQPIQAKTIIPPIHNVISQPQTIAVQQSPQSIQPKNIIPQIHNVVSQPHTITMQQSSPSIQPKNIIPQIHSVVSQPQTIAIQQTTQSIQPKNIIPQIHSVVSQPQTIAIQQPTQPITIPKPQTYIQTTGGFALSTTHNTPTTQTNQVTFSTLSENPLPSLTLPSFTPFSINQTPINQEQTFSVSTHNPTVGTTHNPVNTTSLTAVSVNTLPLNRIPVTQSVKNTQVNHKASTPIIIKKLKPLLPATVSDSPRPVEQSDSKTSQPQHNADEMQKQLETINIDCENSQNDPVTAPTKTVNSENTLYLRVKAPWELNGV